LDTPVVNPAEADNARELLAYARERRDAENYGLAETLCRSALAGAADSAEAHQLLGTILQAQDRVADAVESFQQAIRLEPQNAEAFHQLSIALAELGRLPEALAAVRESLVLRPNHAGALYHLGELKVFHPSDPDLAALEAVSAHADELEERETTFLFFALAKAYDDTGDYDRAFDYLQRANALKRRTIDYDVEDDVRLMRAIAEVFDEQLLANAPNGGSASEAPVLVVGMPRTGTSLVEQILASHPLVYGAGELPYFDELSVAISFTTHRAGGFPRGVPHLDRQELDDFGDAYVRQLQRLDPGAHRIIDKNPFNFLYLGLARLIVPGARIIHCTRDPLDTCLSCYRANFKWMDAAFDLGDLGRYYRAYADLMNHWRRVLPPGSMLEVSYEDVVEDVERQARRLLAHCDLDWYPGCLDFQASPRPVRTTSFVQVRRPLYRDAVARWRNYEGRLGPLLAALEPSE
jgi:tetratricopeptide (TPR) repeat protein